MLKLQLYFSIFLLGLTLVSCHEQKRADVSFYFWKTVYQENKTAQMYLDSMDSKKMYIRMMDVDAGDAGPVPVSPVTFKTAVPAGIEVVPVVFIVNKVIQNQTHQQLDNLAGKIVYYVNGKIKQAGKTRFEELQIDCDWTRTTRDNYFYLLTRIRANPSLKNKKISATLRLHQLKNQAGSGVPPADRVMLMCYNMGNLRKYGTQNSILDQDELEKYAGKNLSRYPMPIDIGLPLFSWAVVFRHHLYTGISRGLNLGMLKDHKLFEELEPSLYTLKQDMPALALKAGDEIRWEASTAQNLHSAAKYLQQYTTTDPINIIYFHLDEQLLKLFPYETLEKTAALFR
jgi:hypothetical protein